MADDPRIAELQAEIARLRAVCEEFDVDPDWRPEPRMYWVEAPWEASLHAMITATMGARRPAIIEAVTRTNPLLRHLTGGARG